MNIQLFRNWLLDERTIIRAVTATAMDNVTALAEVLGLLSVPLIPAILTGLSLVFGLHYTQAQAQAGWSLWASIVLAAVVIIALESLGIAASKTALRLYRAWQDQLVSRRDFLVTLSAVAMYTLLVFMIIALGEGLPPALLWIGYTSPFLAVTMYVVVGFSIDLHERTEQKAQALDMATRIENEVKMADLADYQARLNLKREMDMAAFQAKLDHKYNRLAAPRLSPHQARREAHQILQDEPLITGAELGRRLGLSERTGQLILNEINDANDANKGI
jgi:hypothetical protein